MDLLPARAQSRLGLLTRRAAVSLAFQEKLYKKVIDALLGFGFLALASPALAQITLVNATQCGPASFPGPSCAIPATGRGHLVVVGLQVGSGANTATTIGSITDNVGNGYVEASAARSIDTAAGSVVDFWYAKNSAAGGSTITINPSAGIANAGVEIWEFAGADPSAPLDQSGALNSQGSSPDPVGATVKTGSANEVVLGLAAVAGNITGVYSGNPFTSDSALKGNGWAHLITSSPGTYTPQWSQSPAGTYAASTVSFVAAASGNGTDPCDLNNDGAVNVLDAQLAVTMSLGQAPCTANIDGANICNVVIVQRVVNAANGGACVTGNSHSVSLTWAASTSPNIAGYNVFRGTVSGGPYTQIDASLALALTFSDSSVLPGQTYYYVTTAVDLNNNSSVYSNEASSLIPTP